MMYFVHAVEPTRVQFLLYFFGRKKRHLASLPPSLLLHQPNLTQISRNSSSWTTRGFIRFAISIHRLAHRPVCFSWVSLFHTWSPIYSWCSVDYEPGWKVKANCNFIEPIWDGLPIDSDVGASDTAHAATVASIRPLRSKNFFVYPVRNFFLFSFFFFFAASLSFSLSLFTPFPCWFLLLPFFLISFCVSLFRGKGRMEWKRRGEEGFSRCICCSWIALILQALTAFNKHSLPFREFCWIHFTSLVCDYERSGRFRCCGWASISITSH